MADARCRLYLITPARLEPASFSESLKRALGAGDVACVQLRLKDASDDDFRRAAEILMPLTQAAGAAFIINDRPDLAADVRADGVHVGQEDASFGEARATLGANRIVGVTCHNSRHLAIEAAEAGADYVAFGAFFPTQTKDRVKAHAPIEILSWWSGMMVVPCVAIGGITPKNAKPLVDAGADFLAVSAGVWSHEKGPEAAVKAFNALF
ncbi:MAG: thiamine phosphate synthase [Alphaproteobacteria bacterium]